MSDGAVRVRRHVQDASLYLARQRLEDGLLRELLAARALVVLAGGGAARARRRHDEEVANSNGDVKEICDAIYKSTKPVNNTALPPRYRRNMIKVLVKRACEE